MIHTNSLNYHLTSNLRRAGDPISSSIWREGDDDDKGRGRKVRVSIVYILIGVEHAGIPTFLACIRLMSFRSYRFTAAGCVLGGFAGNGSIILL